MQEMAMLRIPRLLAVALMGTALLSSAWAKESATGPVDRRGAV